MHINVLPSLGDAIYCRRVVKAFATSIDTQWPDLFSDLDVPIRAGVGVKPRYDSKTLIFHSIPGAIDRCFPEYNEPLSLPSFPQPELGRYAVVRVPTLRRDFYAPARNPDMQYLHDAVVLLKANGLTVVGVGNVGEFERFDGEPPNVDLAFWRGELSIAELMGFIAGASLIVAGPGWTVPASMAYAIPHIVVYGGAYKWNAPSALTGDLPHRLVPILPDEPCTACWDVKHHCNKHISRFSERFLDALNRALPM